MDVTSLLIPLLLAAVAVWGLRQRVDVYAAVYMFRASGALDWLTALLAPVLTAMGIPPETTPLLVIRPLSGSGALAAGSELMETYGVDSTIGRTAAVMLGCTETTFYTIAVYFGAAGVRRLRYTIPAALTADLVGFYCILILNICCGAPDNGAPLSNSRKGALP